MYTVVKEITRPPTEAIEALKAYPSAVLSDCLGRYATMDAGIKPLATGQRLIGSAVTIKVYPADNLMIHLSLKIAKPGDILVIDGDGVIDTALMGELVAACAKHQGIAGAVIDGAIRDKAEISAMHWPVFTRGVVPNGPLKNGPGSINVPIACGGLVVNPGDIIVGDDDGVTVIPQAQWQAVVQAAKAVEEKEAKQRQRIEAGEIMWDMLGLDKTIAAFPIEWR